MTCLTPGISVATPLGPRPVEDLRPGDTVITRDNGIRPLAWTGARALDFADLGRAPHLRPILVQAASFGGGLPERDMLVAPNQRIMVPSTRTMLAFEDHEALVAAKHLENHHDVKAVRALGVTYVHIMCARHEVLLANGCWCEAFQPADLSLNGYGNAQRNELAEIFPDYFGAGHGIYAPRGPLH